MSFSLEGYFSLGPRKSLPLRPLSSLAAERRSNPHSPGCGLARLQTPLCGECSPQSYHLGRRGQVRARTCVATQASQTTHMQHTCHLASTLYDPPSAQILLPHTQYCPEICSTNASMVTQMPLCPLLWLCSSNAGLCLQAGSAGACDLSSGSLTFSTWTVGYLKDEG